MKDDNTERPAKTSRQILEEIDRSPELFVATVKHLIKIGQVEMPPELKGKSPEEVDQFLREYFAKH